MESKTGVNVVLPNTVEKKMVAIVALSKAIENVSKALISVNVKVDISGNTINNSDCGININTEEN